MIREEIKKFAKKFIKENGYTPTASEVSRHVGIDRPLAHYHIGIIVRENPKLFPEWRRYKRRELKTKN